MITLDNGRLSMPSSTKATINSSIKIAGTNTTLPIKIEGEFKDIPQHLHEIYIRAMLASYGDTNVHTNAGEEPKTIQEKKREWRLNRIADILLSAIRK